MKDLYFLICENNKKLDIVYEGDNLMSEIINESKKIAGIMDLDLYMSDEELLAKDQEHYYQKGIQDDVENTKKEMIINMHNKSVPIELIADYTNLSIENIESIISNYEE